MTTIDAASVAHLDTSALLRATQECVGKCRRALGALLQYLGEIDTRGVYREQGYNSLFGFCRSLGFSESESQKRVMAARLVRRWPRAGELLVAGRVHLTGLSMLGAHVDKPEIERWIDAAQEKSKQEIADMLAASDVRAPRPRDVLRRLPRAGVLAATPTACVSASSASSASAAIAAASALSSDCGPAASASHGASPLGSEGQTQESSGGSAQVVGDEAIYRLQVTLSDKARALLLRAQDLLRHGNPTIELGATLEVVLREFVDKRLARKFAAGKRARFQAPGAVAGDEETASIATAGESMATATVEARAAGASPTGGAGQAILGIKIAPGAVGAKAAQQARRSRYIPAVIRRAVWLRDGERCAYVGANGARCAATALLELHHHVPFAQGGPHTVDNIAVLCRAHNGLCAEIDFGRENINQRRLLGARGGQNV